MTRFDDGRTREERIGALDALMTYEDHEIRERALAMREGKSDRALEADGLLLKKARVVDESAALYGRARVVLGEDRSRPGMIDRFHVRAGAVVEVRTVDDDGKPARGVRGIVARKRAGELVVVFDEPPETDGLDITLWKSDDDLTQKRLHQALAVVAKAKKRTGELTDIVLGLRAPAPTKGEGPQPFDTAMNDDQRTALRHGVLAPDVALVHGPPGTGKTRVVVEIVRQLVAKGERVLCLTASNAAVDHLALSLLAADRGLPLARAGHPARVDAALEHHTLSAKCETHERKVLAKGLLEQAFKLLRGARRRSDTPGEARRREREARAEAGKLFTDARALERQAVAEVLRTSRVLCGTLTGFLGEIPASEMFDTLVVDEASQALLPALLLAVPHASRIVLAGDHQQLPPTVLSRKAMHEGLADTAFDVLMRRDDVIGFAHMLTVQHRMHEELMHVPSLLSYEGRLVAHPHVAHHALSGIGVACTTPIDAGVPLDVIDTAGAGLDEESPESSESKKNTGEALLVAKIVTVLVEGGLSPADIGVITPYSAQVAELDLVIADLVARGLEIDSVDGFQGREKEAIVFSAVRSNADGETGFLSDARRLNVAITRARRKLIVVGDSATLATDASFSTLFESATERGFYRSVFEIPEFTTIG
jgi:ATP-dependent RNA/DNA helicase IGHMBP2